jgi:hypothetical protein
MQDLQIARYRAQQGREQIVLHYLQLLRLSTKCYGHQDWFLCPGWQETETTGLKGGLILGHGVTNLLTKGMETLYALHLACVPFYLHLEALQK